MKSAVFTALLGAAAVSAHGVMSTFIANGKSFGGPNAGASDGSSPIRPISSVEPVMDVNSDAYGCGPGSQPAGTTAEAAAGSEIEFQMRNGDGGPWVHVMGPTFHSIYKCPGDAGSCNPGRDQGWAVIGQGAGDGQGWVMGKYHRGENVKVRIPSDTPNGDYLVRQELLALHNGHESYIQCVQIRVTGGSDGDLASKGAQLMAYPGTLTGSEPGFSFNVYGVDPNTYPMPGAALFGSSGGSPPPPTNNTPPPPPTNNTPPPPPPSTGGACTAGTIRCDSSSTWSQCANGAWVSMGPVAAGTTCTNGALGRRSSRLFRF